MTKDVTIFQKAPTVHYQTPTAMLAGFCMQQCIILMYVVFLRCIDISMQKHST